MFVGIFVMVGPELTVGELDVGACDGCAVGKVIGAVVGDIVVGIIVVKWEGNWLCSSDGKPVCIDG